MWLTENDSSALALRERARLRLRLRRLDDSPWLLRPGILGAGCDFSDRSSSAVPCDAALSQAVLSDAV